MQEPSQEPGPVHLRPRTANDLFKAGWTDRVAWGTTSAVLIHALLFLWSPSWQRLRPSLDRSERGAYMEAIALQEATSAAGGIPTSPQVGTEEPEPIVEVVDTEAGSEGESEEDVRGRSEEILADLRRRTSPVPTLVEADPVAEAEAERLRIEARAAALDRASLPDGGSLELDRLSALRPELAFLSPSSWVLVQNPTEVVDFMIRNFGGDDPEAEDRGTVSVSLWIDERGSVEWAEVNRSSGRPEVDELALEFFNSVVSFRPAREQGVRVPVAVVFSLPVAW